jgi:uncharacterized OB-fold protein
LTPYLKVPGPVPDDDDAVFWDHCRRHELRFQRCDGCLRFRHPPAPHCPHCRSPHSSWHTAGAGVLFSSTVVHTPRPELGAPGPYVIALVSFPRCGGVRLVSNIVNHAGDESLPIGEALDLVWEDADNGIPLPRFAVRGGDERKDGRP